MKGILFASLALTSSVMALEQRSERNFTDSSLRTPNKGARVYLIGDFLYWSARQNGLDFTYKAHGKSGTLPLSKVKIKDFNDEPSLGFRVGLGYRLPHDRWEACAYVTQLRTTNHLKETAGNNTFIQTNFGQIFSSTTTFTEEMGNWHLKYTLLDIALGRLSPLSKSVALCPFFGARGAQIIQHTHIKLFQEESTIVKIEAKNKYTGGGLRLGADLYFFLAKYAAIFAQGSFSLLSGTFDVESPIKTDAIATVSAKNLFCSREKLSNRLSANAELSAGAKGTIPLYKKEAYLTLGLQYTLSLWFSQNQLLSFFNASNFLQVERLKGDLTLQGITASLRLDF